MLSIFNTSAGQKCTWESSGTRAALLVVLSARPGFRSGASSSASSAGFESAWLRFSAGKERPVCRGLVSLLRWDQRSLCSGVAGLGGGGEEQGRVASSVLLFLLFLSLLWPFKAAEVVGSAEGFVGPAVLLTL